MASTNELLALLHEALRDPARRRELIDRFQQLVWNAPALEAEGPAWEVFADLAHDLDFYEPDPDARREDPSYYDDQRLEEEIREGLRKLESLEARG